MVEKIPTWLAVVAVALQRADNRWLMQRRAPGKHHGGLWEFPGGKVEDVENPRFALAREAQEELGIMIDPGELSPAGFADGGHSRDGVALVILLYTCTRWTGEPASLEGGEVGWFTPEKIAGLAKPPLDKVLAATLFGSEPG